MKIVFLEKVQMINEQVARLKKLGEVIQYDNSNENECKERIIGADAVVVNWIDPSPFVLIMKSPSLLALMSTGYGWIQHRSEARQRGVLISNIPGYASEAVAEHLVGLALNVARQTTLGDRNIRAGEKKKGYLEGIELKGRRIGIIGLGRIGQRVAEITQCLGMDVVSYNRHPKSLPGVQDLDLDDLLASCDVVCISCPLNDESRGMLTGTRLNLLKQDAIIIGATWNVIVLEDLISILKNRRIRGAGFDAAIEGEEIELPASLKGLDNVVITPHIGYNTYEAKVRQVDICISNIKAFKDGKPLNIIN